MVKPEESGNGRHVGPTIPPGEISGREALENVLKTHDNRSVVYVSIASFVLAVYAVRYIADGRMIAGLAFGGWAVWSLVMFVVSGAKFRAVQRRPWARWLVRSWVLLYLPLVVVLVQKLRGDL